MPEKNGIGYFLDFLFAVGCSIMQKRNPVTGGNVVKKIIKIEINLLVLLLIVAAGMTLVSHLLSAFTIPVIFYITKL